MNGIRQSKVPLKKKPQEFWEGDDWRNYFTDPDYQAGQQPFPDQQPPAFDVGQLTEQAIGPMRLEYERGLEGMASRLSKRRMGESGAYGVAENEALRNFLAQVGAVSSDITMRGAEFGLKERAERHRHEEELGRQGLTQQEIDNEMIRFDQTLAWEKEKFGEILDWDKRKHADDIAFRYAELLQNGELTQAQMDQDMEIFVRGLAFETDMRWGWTDDQGVYHPGTTDMEIWEQEREDRKTDIAEMKIFGYWDEGYGPDDPNMPEEQYDQYGNPTGAWADYYNRYYNKGDQDFRDWELRIDAILGLTGVSNQDVVTPPPPGEPPPGPGGPNQPPSQREEPPPPAGREPWMNLPNGQNKYNQCRAAGHGIIYCMNASQYDPSGG